jgi:hypothetical protein
VSAGKSVALLVGGALIGSGATYLITKNVLEKKFEARTEEEIASVRDSYIERMRILEDELRSHPVKPSVTVKEPVRTVEDIPKERVVPTNEELRTAYHKIKPSAEAVQELQETVEGLGYVREEEAVKEEEARLAMGIAEPDDDEPSVIPVQAYFDNEEGYAQYTLTYYVGDKTLVFEDSDQVVEDVDQTVGFHNLHNFGVESGNDDTVYVRNNKKESEYEILRDPGKYSENQLSVDTWADTPEPPIKKFR